MSSPPGEKPTQNGLATGLAAKVLHHAEHAALLPPVASPFKVRGRTAAEVLATVPATPDWLIPGIAVRGWAVKFAAREKAGKGTLIFNLLGHLERGEPTVFGPAASEPVTFAVYSEEPEDSLREKIAAARLEHARILQSHDLPVDEFGGWEVRADYLVELLVQEDLEGLFVDNISRATGAEDENGTELARKVEYLVNRAREARKTVFVDHHHRKSGGKAEDKSRGGTALAGAMDCNVEIERHGGHDSRARTVSSRGRLAATVWECIVELSEDGTDYRMVADDEENAVERERLELLENAGEAGVTVGEFAGLINRERSTAARQLREFVEVGAAERLEGERPIRYRYRARPDIG